MKSGLLLLAILAASVLRTLALASDPPPYECPAQGPEESVSSLIVIGFGATQDDALWAMIDNLEDHLWVASAVV